MRRKTLTIFGKKPEFDVDVLDAGVYITSNQYGTVISYIDEAGKRPKIKLKKYLVSIKMED